MSCLFSLFGCWCSWLVVRIDERSLDDRMMDTGYTRVRFYCFPSSSNCENSSSSRSLFGVEHGQRDGRKRAHSSLFDHCELDLSSGR